MIIMMGINTINDKISRDFMRLFVFTHIVLRRSLLQSRLITSREISMDNASKFVAFTVRKLTAQKETFWLLFLFLRNNGLVSTDGCRDSQVSYVVLKFTHLYNHFEICV